MDNQSLLDNLTVFKTIADNSRSLIIITDTDGKILYVNKSAEKITGFPEKELVGNKPNILGKLMDNNLYQKLWQTVKNEKKVFRCEIKNKKKNGQIYYSSLFVFPIMKGTVLTGFAGIEDDITELKDLDNKKTEFLSIASHQLQTPLGSMRWNMEMLLGGEFGKIPKNIKEIIEDLYQSDLRIISLVNDLLSVSRIDQGRIFDEPKDTDIVELIKSVAFNIEIEAQKRSLKGELQFGKEKIPHIFIDPRRLREVMHNLLSNAIKYTKPGGKITVQVKLENDCIVISVIDTGIGIPKNESDKIFNKFFRATNAQLSQNEGSGLGLYIVKSYVKGWGGKIWFTSSVDNGTTFTFTLPLLPQEQKAN